MELIRSISEVNIYGRFLFIAEIRSLTYWKKAIFGILKQGLIDLLSMAKEMYGLQTNLQQNKD